MTIKNVKDWLEDPHTRMVDLLYGLKVEVDRDQQGKVWINVDGICVLRIGQTDELKVTDLRKREAKS